MFLSLQFHTHVLVSLNCYTLLTEPYCISCAYEDNSFNSSRFIASLDETGLLLIFSFILFIFCCILLKFLFVLLFARAISLFLCCNWLFILKYLCIILSKQHKPHKKNFFLLWQIRSETSTKHGMNYTYSTKFYLFIYSIIIIMWQFCSKTSTGRGTNYMYSTTFCLFINLL